jgi:hypothetical protein
MHTLQTVELQKKPPTAGHLQTLLWQVRPVPCILHWYVWPKLQDWPNETRGTHAVAVVLQKWVDGQSQKYPVLNKGQLHPPIVFGQVKSRKLSHWIEAVQVAE